MRMLTSSEPLEFAGRVTFEVVDYAFDKALCIYMEDCRANVFDEFSKVACAFVDRPLA